MPALKFAADASALDRYLGRDNTFQFEFGRRRLGISFAPEPTDAEKAAATKAIEDAQKLVDKAVEAVDAKYKKTIDGLSQQVRKLSGKPREPDPAEDDDDADPEADAKAKPKVKQSAADKEIAERLKKIEERTARVQKNATRTALKSAFNAVGITGDDEADAVDLFLAREGARLTYDDENDVVLIKISELDDPKPLSEHIAGLDKAGKLNRFKGAVKTPPNDGGREGRAGSAAGKNNFSADDLRSGKVSREALRKG